MLKSKHADRETRGLSSKTRSKTSSKSRIPLSEIRFRYYEASDIDSLVEDSELRKTYLRESVVSILSWAKAMNWSPEDYLLTEYSQKKEQQIIKALLEGKHIVKTADLKLIDKFVHLSKKRVKTIDKAVKAYKASCLSI